MLASFIEGPGPYYRLPGNAPGGADKTLVSDASGKIAWADASGAAGLEARVEALESAVVDVEGPSK